MNWIEERWSILQPNSMLLWRFWKACNGKEYWEVSDSSEADDFLWRYSYDKENVPAGW